MAVAKDVAGSVVGECVVEDWVEIKVDDVVVGEYGKIGEMMLVVFMTLSAEATASVECFCLR